MSLPIAQRWSDRTWLIEYALPPIICLAFSLLIVSTASTLILQAGFLDPYVYAGYVNDYFGTFQRYGHTYYSSRIAYIFLDKAFVSIFGQAVGLFLCRLLVLGASAYAAFLIAKRYFGLGPALIAVSWLCFIPWLLRSVAWTHYDGFATAYLLIALAFMIASRRHRLLAHGAAGFFLALAVNCNLHLLMVAGLFVPSWLWLNRRSGNAKLVYLTLATTAGFIAGYMILQILFSLAIGNFRVFIEAAAFNSARSLLAGQLANWFHPFSKLIAGGVFLFLIPTFFTAGGVVALAANWRTNNRDARDFLVAALTYSALLFSGALVLHYFYQHTWFSVFYYDVYFLPACLLVLISLAGFSFASTPRTAWILYFATTTALIGLWFCREGLNITLPVDLRPWLYFSIAVLIGALLRPKLTAAPVLMMGLVCATYGIFQMQPGVMQQYVLWSGRDMTLQSDVYRGAVFLQEFIRRRVPSKTAVGFWYSNDPKNVNLNSMQAMFLWGYSRLQNHSGPGMPEIDEYFKEQVRLREFIAIMARSDQEIDAAYEALRHVPIRPHEVARTSYSSKTESYLIALAELHSIPAQLGNELREIPPKDLHPQNGALLTSTADGADLKTAPCLWCYSAMTTPSSLPPSSTSEVILRMTVTMTSGQVGIATVTSDDVNNLANLTTVVPRAGKQTIDIKIKAQAKENIIVVRNESPLGSGQMTIHSIGYYSPN